MGFDINCLSAAAVTIFKLVTQNDESRNIIPCIHRTTGACGSIVG
jgi:hypothetical protein